MAHGLFLSPRAIEGVPHRGTNWFISMPPTVTCSGKASNRRAKELLSRMNSSMVIVGSSAILPRTIVQWQVSMISSMRWNTPARNSSVTFLPSLFRRG